MPNTITEGKHAGEFAVSLCDPQYCNEQITVLSGQDLDAGHVVGKVTMGAATPAAFASRWTDVGSKSSAAWEKSFGTCPYPPGNKPFRV